jgi:hypothetical protein
VRGHKSEEKLMGHNEPKGGLVMDSSRKATEEAYTPNCMATGDVVLPGDAPKPTQTRCAREESRLNTWKST